MLLLWTVYIGVLSVRVSLLIQIFGEGRKKEKILVSFPLT